MLEEIQDEMRPLLDGGVYKSPYDTRKYRHMQLANGIKLLLISDMESDEESSDESSGEDTDSCDSETFSDDDHESHSHQKHMVSVSVCVHTGSLQDPPDILGLSHFLEHLLFMGSEKYPDPSEFAKYISEHGGMTNAYTSSMQTNYFFSIPIEHFEEALDRFVQFFISPLLDESTIENERIAVDNEFQRLKLSDHSVHCGIMKTLMVPNHPASFFDAGNLITLKDNIEKSGVNLRGRVLEYWSKFYSPRIMTAAVYAPLPMPEIEEAIFSLLSSIPDKPVDPSLEITIDWDKTFDMKKFNKIITYKSFKNGSSLTLSWITPPIINHYMSKPLDVIAYIIGHEGHGSLFSYFKQKNWIYQLAAGTIYTDVLSNRHFSTFQIQMDLSNEGFNNYHEIVKVIFCFIQMLKNCNSYERVFKDCQTNHLLNFLFDHLAHPSEITEQISSSMNIYPPELYLVGEQVPLVYDYEKIHQFLNHFTVDNLNILLGIPGDDFTGDQIEPWYNVPYRSQGMPEHWSQLFKESVLPQSLSIPRENQFTPSSLKIPDSDSKITPFPECVFETEKCRLYYKFDDHFKLPKCSIRLLFRFHADEFEKIFGLIDFYFHSFKFIHQEIIYEAEMGNFDFKIGITPCGNLKIQIDGFENKIDVFTVQIIKCFVDTQVMEEQFISFKEKIVNRYKDKLKKQSELSINILAKLFREKALTSLDLLEKIEKLTFSEYEEFQKRFKCHKMFIDSLFCGCITAEKSKNILQQITSILDHPALPKELFLKESFKDIGNFTRYSTLSREPTDNQLSVLNIYQFENFSFSRAVDMSLINYLLNPFIFETLRDNEQLGYEVFSSIVYPYRAGLLCIGVVSDVEKKSCEYIDWRIENAITMFIERLEAMPPEDYSNKVNALIKKTTQEYSNLEEMSDRLFDEVTTEMLMFNRKTLKAQKLASIEKDNLVQMVKSYMENFSASRRKMTIQIIGKNRNEKTTFCR